MDGVIGDSELSGILVLAGCGINDAKPVARDIGLKAGRGSPNEAAGVAEIFYQTIDGDNVGGWAAQELDVDSARSCTLR